MDDEQKDEDDEEQELDDALDEALDDKEDKDDELMGEELGEETEPRVIAEGESDTDEEFEEFLEGILYILYNQITLMLIKQKMHLT